VSGFAELHLRGEIAQVLEAWGWRADTPAVRECVPAAARGNNVVLVASPSPAAAAPLLAAALSRLGPEVRGLVLCPPSQVAEWGGLAHALGAAAGLRVEAATGAARPLRRLRADALDLLVASPDTVSDLLTRGALKADRLALVLLVQPEGFAEHAALTVLMQDVPKDAQRLVVTADSDASAGVVERYARKALVVGGLPAGAVAEPVKASVRTVSVGWSQRETALADLLHVLDPARAVIWAADLSHAASIARAIPLDGDAIQLVTGDVPPADVVLAFDLPTAERLAQLTAAGDTVLLVPPGTEPYVGRIASATRPLPLPGLAEQLARLAAGDRAAVLAELESGPVQAAVQTLAPLFERVDPVRVAAALFNLWKGTGGGPAAPRAGSGVAAPETATAKVWVSIGKKDGVTPNDLVGALTRELRVERDTIGRIELRDSFSLVEFPAADAARIAQALSGTTIRRVRVIARLDRTGGGGGDRGAARGERPPRSGGDRPARPATRRAPRERE
jgi:ATP-dependent RNA helicase DeaD